MKAMIIINPISGTLDKHKLAAYVEQKLKEAGISATQRWTAAKGDATRLSKEAVLHKYDIVVAIGGDGTVNECAKAVRDSDTALAIIPAGSGNGLARHMGIPMDIEGAVKAITEGCIVDSDYGLVEDIPFVCTFGVGFDAWVGEKFAQKKRRGMMSYVNTVFSEYQKYQPEVYTIKSGDEIITEKAFLITVCNASQYGNNVYVAPHASVTDGLLDVTIVHYDNAFTNALVGWDMITGMIDKNVYCKHLRTSQATITRNDGGPAHIDGEPLRMGEVINFSCHKGGLKIYAPLAEEHFLPYITPIKSMFRDLQSNVRNLLSPL